MVSAWPLQQQTHICCFSSHTSLDIISNKTKKEEEILLNVIEHTVLSMIHHEPCTAAIWCVFGPPPQITARVKSLDSSSRIPRSLSEPLLQRLFPVCLCLPVGIAAIASELCPVIPSRFLGIAGKFWIGVLTFSTNLLIILEQCVQFKPINKRNFFFFFCFYIFQPQDTFCLYHAMLWHNADHIMKGFCAPVLVWYSL